MRMEYRVTVFLAGVLLIAPICGCRRGDQEPAKEKENGDVAAKQDGDVAAKPDDGDQPAVDETTIEALIKALKSEDDTAEAAAAAKLAAMGAAAAPAIDALVAELEDNDPLVRANAVRALGRIGDPAKPAAEAIVKLITDEDAVVRRSAMHALHSIKPGKDKVVPLMIKALQDADPHVVALAINALAEEGAEIVPAMIEAMKDDRTIYWAILVLYEIGPDAKDAVPELAKALSHEKEEVRHEAAHALRAIGADAKEAVPALVEALDDELILVRLPSVLALGSIGPDAKPAVDKLTSYLEAEDALLKVCAVWALAKIEPDDERLKTETVPALMEFLKDEDQEARRAAALALLQLDPGPEIMIPAFLGAFDSASPEVRSDMLEAIASLGEEAVPGMIRGLKYPDIRKQVAEILGRIGEGAKEAVPALLEHVNDEDPQVQAEVLFALGCIGGPEAKGAIDAAIAVLQDENERVRVSGMYLLGKLGPDAAAAAPELKKILKSDDPKSPRACMWALVRIEPDNEEVAKLAVPMMISGLEDEDAFVRIEAARTLELIGPAAKEAIPALKKLEQDDPDPEVREAAVDAIQSIGE
jgi:HEAT repeat protein